MVSDPWGYTEDGARRSPQPRGQGALLGANLAFWLVSLCAHQFKRKEEERRLSHTWLVLW